MAGVLLLVGEPADDDRTLTVKGVQLVFTPGIR
jgi:hypothetical protein